MGVEHAHHCVKRTRPVLQLDLEPGDSPSPGEIAQQHIGEQPGVDIAAAQHQADLLACKPLGIGQHRRETSRARAFDHGLLDLQQQRNRVFERRLANQQDLVDQRRDDLRGEFAGRLDRNAFGERVAAADRILAAQLRIHRGVKLGLDPDHLDRRVDRSGDRCHPAHQPAAADRHHQAIEVGLRREHLERHRALTRRDIGIVEGVDEGKPALLLELTGMGIGLVEGLAEQFDLPADALGLHHLHRRRGLGHHDGHRHAQPCAVIGQALAVISRRGRDHPARTSFLVEQQQGVERPALLVGRGEL